MTFRVIAALRLHLLNLVSADKGAHVGLTRGPVRSFRLFKAVEFKSVAADLEALSRCKGERLGFLEQPGREYAKYDSDDAQMRK